MDSKAISEELVRGLHVIRSLLDGMAQGEAQRKPDPESWSALEVLCHLLDEEREDFRMHIQQVYTDPQEVWHPIAPPLWVVERRYQDQSMET